MIVENGQWIMKGASPRSRGLLHNCEEMIGYVDKVGFLPLFSNDVEGFSVEEHADARYWWSGDPERDPWEWRVQAAQSGKVCYGKFFAGKAGFISLSWLGCFANFRRDGYDFDSLYEEGLAKAREKRIMELFDSAERLYSYELKAMGGFGKGGLKNFSGIVTELQHKLYLTVTDFRCRRNKRGEEYGMPVAQYAPPEKIWGYEAVSAEYGSEPERSAEKAVSYARTLWGSDSEKALKSLLL